MQQTEQEVSILEKRRLHNIDKELGTKTYFYEPKVYEIKLDSEHVMQIKRLKARVFVEGLMAPDRFDSKVNIDLKVRNRKTFWKNLSKLSR